MFETLYTKPFAILCCHPKSIAENYGPLRCHNIYRVSAARFQSISKIGGRAEANTWSMAMDISINIYLDLINLFLQLLDLMSKK
jgi:predicted metal-dependent peptidase